MKNEWKTYQIQSVNWLNGKFSVLTYFLDKFRGDIVGKAALYNRLRVKRRKLRRNGVNMNFDKWPGSKIPYVISQRYSKPQKLWFQPKNFAHF